MKQLIQTGFKGFFLLLVASFYQAVVLAQDSTGATRTTTSTSTETTTWYTEPWVWVVGGAVFILLIVALVRGSGSSNTGSTDRVSVTKTVTRDSDVA